MRYDTILVLLRRCADQWNAGHRTRIGDLSNGDPVDEGLFREEDFLEEALSTLDEDDFDREITARRPRAYRDVVAGCNDTTERRETSTTIHGQPLPEAGRLAVAT